MAIFAYGTVLQKSTGAIATTSSTLGYAEAVNEDEARGIAVRNAMELQPDFNIVQVNVIEVAGAAFIPLFSKPGEGDN